MGRKKSKKQQSGLDELFSDHFTANDMEPIPDDYDGELVEMTEEELTGYKDGIQMMRLSLIEPNPDQPRKDFDDEALGSLADSVKKHGILQPLLVRPMYNGSCQIIAGERRWRAARLAELTEVPVIVKEYDDEQTAQLALVENLQREDLNPVDEAMGYQSLIDSYGYTQQEVAEIVGKPRSSVANALRLLSLSAAVRELLVSGELSAGHGKLLAGLDEKLQEELAKRAVGEALSVKQLSALIEAAKRQKPAPKVKPKRPTFLVEAELALKQAFGQPVKIEQAKGGKTKLTIECKSDEEFRELMKRLTD